MTPRELKVLAARETVKARVLSDGCRDYLLEVVSDQGRGVLRHRRGRPLMFRSLEEVRDLLERCGIQDAVIRQRVADNEACAAGPGPAFHELRLSPSR